jgi:mannose-6-phosphate isomerase-like protein (cupin superfamily)
LKCKKQKPEKKMKVLPFSEADLKEVSHNPKIKKRVVLSKGECGNISQLAQAVFPPNETAHAHSHKDMTEIFIVQSGLGILQIDKTSHELKPDVCAVVEPNETHEISNTGTNDLVITIIGIDA